MDTRRIDGAVDTAAMAAKCVALVGAGGAAGLARDLVRSGLGAVVLVDKDTVGAENVCRQEHMADQVGMPKAEALTAELRRINPDARVTALHADITRCTDAEAATLFASTDVL